MNRFPANHCWPPVWTNRQDPPQILLTNKWVNAWAWNTRPAFLRRPSRHGKILFAGPWVGEFGWELLNWQAYLRVLRPRYDKVVVSARESSRAMYADFCDEFVPHTISGQSNSHVSMNIQNPDELVRILSLVPPGTDHLVPLRYIPSEAQRFIRFGNPQPTKYAVDVLLHARGRSHDTVRNWSEDKWNQLADRLREKGLRLACIGLSSSALAVPDTEDFRDLPLQETFDLMASSRLMLGPSSGPLHLASLCGLPHLVWTDRRSYGMGKTSRDKYETWWNPLNTPVHVMDEHDFDPPVEAVFASAIFMLERGGMR